MLTNVLFYVSSAINPILYNLVSATYRQVFFATLRYFFLPCRHTPRRQLHPLTRHSISISSNHTFTTNIIKETTVPNAPGVLIRTGTDRSRVQGILRAFRFRVL
uniref:G-protein coupled receptors family 1 profile domain-containing protein n=1 Tax=Cyprinodon variegatus TaxID=28743 RepID=A0A3Q2CRM6_CYPVA